MQGHTLVPPTHSSIGRNSNLAEGRISSVYSDNSGKRNYAKCLQFKLMGKREASVQRHATGRGEAWRYIH